MPGQKADGNKFVSEAISRGAIAIASAEPRGADASAAITWVQLVPGTERRALAIAAANYYGHPASALKLIGVTGTNGKTTTTFLVDSILHAAGFITGRIGTTGYRNTARDSHSASIPRLNRWTCRKCSRKCAMPAVRTPCWKSVRTRWRWSECGAATLLSAIFTNLTRDHLNFHKTFEEYFAAKRRLFEGTGAGAPDVAVINADDPYSSRLEGLAKRTLDIWADRDCAELTTKKFALRFDGL